MFKLISTLLRWIVDCRRICRSIKVQGVTESGVRGLHQINTLVESLTMNVGPIQEIQIKYANLPGSLVTDSIVQT